MGKTLLELRAEIDEQHRAVRTVTDNHACISWQDNGTLTYFGYTDGWPADYWAEWHDDAIENYTSIERWIAHIKMFELNSYEQYILDAPVWCVIDEEYHTVCRLLDDIPVDL